MNLNMKMFYTISGYGRGWVFSARDLMKSYPRELIDNTLSDLAEMGKIRRIMRGLYDYPKYSELLNQYLSPDIDQAARALARKFNWRIEISGESALNMLGISNQIPGRYIYLSDGPSKSYDIMGTDLEFKHSSLKDIGFKYKESSLLTQAIKALGKDHLYPNFIKKIRDTIEPKMYNRILKDTQSTTGWIYENIKEICT